MILSDFSPTFTLLYTFEFLNANDFFFFFIDKNH